MGNNGPATRGRVNLPFFFGGKGERGGPTAAKELELGFVAGGELQAPCRWEVNTNGSRGGGGSNARVRTCLLKLWWRDDRRTAWRTTGARGPMRSASEAIASQRCVCVCVRWCV